MIISVCQSPGLQNQMKKPIKTLMFLSASDAAFLAHRVAMADAAHQRCRRVVIVCADTGRMEEIKKLGFDVHALPDGNRSFFSLLRMVFCLVKLYRFEQPQIIHHSSVLMSFIGSIAGLFHQQARCINAITGVGYLFSSDSFRAKFLRALLTPVLRFLWSGEKTVMLFQNTDDRALLAAKGLAPFTAPIIRGSGVDIQRFVPVAQKELLTEKASPLIIGCASRLIRDKGLEELIAAVSSFGPQRRFELHIAGSSYASNPTSFTQENINSWASIEAVRLKGQLCDMPAFWQGCDIAILPSHREGLPKALLEAAACGLPLLGADVPGTREIIRHRYNGLLFKKGDTGSIADAITQMTEDPAFMKLAGKKSRQMIETEGFSDDAVGTAYQDLLASI